EAARGRDNQTTRGIELQCSDFGGCCCVSRIERLSRVGWAATVDQGIHGPRSIAATGNWPLDEIMSHGVAVAERVVQRHRRRPVERLRSIRIERRHAWNGGCRIQVD